MPQQYKIDKVQEIMNRIEGAKSIVLVDFKGINIQEVDELRNRMRNANVDYFVAKNTYVKIALQKLGIEALNDVLVGPTAVAVCKEDEVAPARELAKFKKDVMEDKEFPSFKAGYIGDQFFAVTDLEALAKLPSREELIAKMLSSFNAPISNFVGVLNGIVREFVGVIDAIAKKKAEEN